MKHKMLKPQQGFFPQPIYLIGTINEARKVNFAPVSWITSCSGEPPGIMIAMTKKMLTCENIIKTKMFSANLTTRDMRQLVDYCGSVSGYDHDKTNYKGSLHYLNPQSGIPVLSDSPWVYECEVTQTIELQTSMVFLSKITNINVDNSIEFTEYGNIDLKQIDPLIYSPSQYFALGEYLGAVN